MDKTKVKSLVLKRVPNCVKGCPLNNQIDFWLDFFKRGDYLSAYKLLLANDPFPAIVGRVCFHRCELACNRKKIDSSVANHKIEAWLGDWGIIEGWRCEFPPLALDKKILVVGSGPAGLSAAFYLRSLGYSVTVVEKEEKVGGMIYYGIPNFRLNKLILEREVDRLIQGGVKFICNYEVKDLLEEKKGYRAVFLAFGASLGKKIDIPGDIEFIEDALSFLKRAVNQQLPSLGKKIAVYGGGNTAIDVARLAIRLGYQVVLIYHRTEERMSALVEEKEQAIAEGVEIKLLRSVISFKDRQLKLGVNECSVTGEIMQTGKIETLLVDYLVLALSQEPNSHFLKSIPELAINKEGLLSVDHFYRTGLKNVFAGGDLITKERSLTVAVKHGRDAAYAIDFCLKQKEKNKAEVKQRFDSELEIPKQDFALPLVKEGQEVDAEAFFELKEREPMLKNEAERCLACRGCIGKVNEGKNSG